VEDARGNRWVPTGRSVWEVGTDEDVTAEADDDYDKRKVNPGGFVPSETTLVFVSTRRSDARDAWAREKQSEGSWKDAVALDADSLERWLDVAARCRPHPGGRYQAGLGQDLGPVERSDDIGAHLQQPGNGRGRGMGVSSLPAIRTAAVV
jgi:hypothetical protein